MIADDDVRLLRIEVLPLLKLHVPLDPQERRPQVARPRAEAGVAVVLAPVEHVVGDGDDAGKEKE